MFDTTVKNNLIFCEASEAEDLPNEPGIYAWFFPLDADDTGDLKRLVTSLIQKSNHAQELTKVHGNVAQLEISLSRSLPELAQEELIADLNAHLNSVQIQKAARLLLVCSFLTAPIYVGMTIDMGLRDRVRSHLRDPGQLNDANWNGSFCSRAAWRTRDSAFLQRCLVVCLPMPIALFPPDMVKLFEHLLIRTIRPPLSRRG